MNYSIVWRKIVFDNCSSGCFLCWLICFGIVCIVFGEVNFLNFLYGLLYFFFMMFCKWFVLCIFVVWEHTNFFRIIWYTQRDVFWLSGNVLIGLKIYRSQFIILTNHSSHLHLLCLLFATGSLNEKIYVGTHKVQALQIPKVFHFSSGKTSLK